MVLVLDTGPGEEEPDVTDKFLPFRAWRSILSVNSVIKIKACEQLKMDGWWVSIVSIKLCEPSKLANVVLQKYPILVDYPSSVTGWTIRGEAESSEGH